MKIHAFRLTKGMDLKKSIEDYVVENKIKSGVILSAVGCLYKVTLRTADGVTVKSIDKDYEIVYFEGKLKQRTASLVKGFDAVVAFVNDEINEAVINTLYENGVYLLNKKATFTLI